MRTMCKLSLVLFGLISSLIPCAGQQQNAASAAAPARKTFIVIYKPGPGWLPGKSLREQPLQEHGKYVFSLHAQGVLKLGGPFADDAGGATVIEAADDAEAKAIVAKDPAVVAQIFVTEVHPWALVQWEQMPKK